MEKMYTGLSQIVIAFIKIVVLLLLPLVGFVVPLVGIPIPGIALRGLSMFNSGNMLILIPVIVYVAMILTALGPMQKYSWIAAVIALIIEIVFLAIPSDLLTSGDIGMLIQLIPAEYKQYVDFGIQKLAKPGLGLFINMGLTLLYIICYVVGGMLFGTSGGKVKKQVGGGQNRGGINPPVV